jgi:hypothetical protein
MRHWMSRLAAVAVLGGLVACSGGKDTEIAPPATPQPLWSGYLASLDSADVDETGIKLEILSGDPAVPAQAVSYRLTTGCTGVGSATRDGKVMATEVLRPCLADDVARIGRLNDIADQGDNADGGAQATLVWDDSTATLSSSDGQATFAPDSSAAAATSKAG